MRLELATWLEVETYLEHSRAIIVPIGSTEQHGPTGLLGTDAITAEAIARGIGEQLGVFVTPTIWFGMAQYHLAFAGTISLRPSTLAAVIRDVVASLVHHGFNRIYFVNGHGGNADTVNAAFNELHAETSFQEFGANDRPIRCVLRSWFVADGIQSLGASLYGSADGLHATASEVAVTQFRHPEHIKKHVLDPAVAPGLTQGLHDAFDFRQRYPDGRVGSNPALATPEHGKLIIEAAIASMSEDFLAFAGSQQVPVTSQRPAA